MTVTKISTLGLWATVLLLLGTCAFLLFFQLDEVPFFGDETLYVRVAARALHTGQWAPLLGDRTAFVWKPPIVVWGNGAGMALLGENELGARLGVGLAALLLCALLAWYGLRIGNRWTMVLAPLTLVSAPGLLLEHGLRSANPEAWLLLAVTASFVFFLETGAKSARVRLGGLALLSCFSSWTKGLVGPLVVGGALFLVELAVPRETEAEPATLRRRLARAIVTAGAATLPGLLFYLAWLLFSLGSVGDVLYFLGIDLARRSGAGLDPLHLQPPSIYIRAAIENFGYFALLAPLALAVRLLRSRRDPGVAATHDRRIHSTLLLWIVVTFVLFAIPSSRLVWYVFPAYPALALATALLLDQVRSLLVRWRGGLAAFLLLLALLGAARIEALARAWPEREPHSLGALQRFLDSEPDARAFVERALGRGAEDGHPVAQWHRHYLRRFPPLDGRALPAEAPRCSFVVTAEPAAWRPLLGDRLAGVTGVRGELPGQLKLFVLDLCGGRFSGGAQSSP